MNLNTKYLGLDVQSPIIAGSCNLTNNIDSILKLEDAGVGAVVLKSIFEEEIIYDIKRNTHIVAPIEKYGEAYNYVSEHANAENIENYLELIRQAKERTKIPIVGSINCYSHENWITYAKKYEEAGCDALELNINLLPYETSLSCDDVERVFGDIIRTLRKVTAMPLAIKVGRQFTDMAKFMQQLSWMGIHGITIFNKNITMDIDIEAEQHLSPSIFTSPSDINETIHWVSLLCNKLRCDISASSGVETATDVIKLLLAGAGTVQTVSSLYRNGEGHVKTLNEGLAEWMNRKGYEKISDFKGKLSTPNGVIASEEMRVKAIQMTNNPIKTH